MTLRIFNHSALFLISLLLLLMPRQLSAEPDISVEEEAAFQYLNRLRRDAGMIPFSQNRLLKDSAFNHALYLSSNGISSHYQKEGKLHFTGADPGLRAAHSGYELLDVTENFSTGQKNSLDSIDGLMAAIYHRFAFLDFSRDEIGIALYQADSGFNFVYNMGNSELNRFCRFAIYQKEGHYYQDICRRSARISSVKFDAVKGKTQAANPPIVVWPPDSARDVPVVFYEEIPDPLPNLSISGYPVSIQFNPHYIDDVQMQEFTLFHIKADQRHRVSPIHVMDRQNDPNDKFTEHQFALFPLQRLEWGSEYQAVATFIHNGKSFRKAWRFHTVKMPYDLFRIRARKEVLLLEPNKTYGIFIVPQNNLPFVERLQWKSPSTVFVETAWYDKNTILLSLSGEHCQEVVFSLNENRFFSAQLAESDNLNPQHSYPNSGRSACVKNRVKNLPGFRIKGKYEVLKMKIRQAYWIEILSDRPETGNIRMHYPDNMTIAVKRLGNNVIKIVSDGKPGQSADIYLDNRKTFRIILEK